MKMRVSVSFVYISRALVRERFSRNTNKRVSVVRWGKKEFQKEQKKLYLVSRNARKQQQQQDDAKL
jgi:hypothetical protein